MREAQLKQVGRVVQQLGIGTLPYGSEQLCLAFPQAAHGGMRCALPAQALHRAALWETLPGVDLVCPSRRSASSRLIVPAVRCLYSGCHAGGKAQGGGGPAAGCAHSGAAAAGPERAAADGGATARASGHGLPQGATGCSHRHFPVGGSPETRQGISVYEVVMALLAPRKGAWGCTCCSAVTGWCVTHRQLAQSV